MAAGIRHPGLRRALEALCPEEDLQIRLLTRFPTSNDGADHGASLAPDSAFEDYAHASCDVWETVTEGTSLVRQNASLISFGTLLEDLPNVVGWAIFDGSETEMLAYGPLIDSAGVETTRSFLAGDEVQFPATAIKIGLT